MTTLETIAIELRAQDAAVAAASAQLKAMGDVTLGVSDELLDALEYACTVHTFTPAPVGAVMA